MANLPTSYIKLTSKQRIYVDGILSGLTKKAACAAAGGSKPDVFEESQNVRDALADMMAKGAEEVGFSRKEAHDMYMEAYRSAETAMEQIAAVNAMVKLHGLEAPKKVEVEHTHSHSGELELLPTAELMKLAKLDKKLALPGEFEVIEDRPALEPPEVTDENTHEPAEVSRMRDGY